jgi:Fic family protein
MHIPMVPPDAATLLEIALRNHEGQARIAEIFRLEIGPIQNGKYRHWDILRHLQPPHGLSVEDWWLAIKVARRVGFRDLPLVDRDGQPFRYGINDVLMEMLHRIDRQASGAIKGSDQVIDPQTRDTYLFKSLVEESITSSQLEGASTTRLIAKEMLRTGREPVDRSERMIRNNFEAMQFIRSLRGSDLTPAGILELRRIVTHETLEDPSEAGRFRRADEPIVVEDSDGKVLHSPPASNELPDRMQRLCDFANSTTSTPFLHPAVRSIMLHFGLAYDHPFVDGNGRTARALFYWSMARQGFWLAEFISISRVLKQAPSRYSRAFLYTETDDNDATYFILNQARVILEAIDSLHGYLARKADELRGTDDLIRRSIKVQTALNPRQLGLVNHALKHAGFVYSIASHRRSHEISQETARKDLLELAERGLLEQQRGGRRFLYVAPDDLRTRLETMADQVTRPSAK